MTEDLKQAVALLPELEKQLANAVENHHGLRVSHKTTQAIIAALRALEPIAAGTHVIVSSDEWQILSKIKQAVDECKDDTWQCPVCGHAETWWTNSNAHFLSEYPLTQEPKP
jgi:rubrerythrin